MSICRAILFISIVGFFSACGSGGDSTATSVTGQTTATPTTHKVTDKWVKVNGNVNLDSDEIITDANFSTYMWKDNGDVVSTERTFIYTPTEVGVNVLDLSVYYENGDSNSDSIDIMVTNEDVNVSVEAISELVKTEYLSAINDARTTNQDCRTRGTFSATTTLTWNEKLYSASYEHTQDLIASQTFSHAGSGTESDWIGYKLSKQSDLVDRSEGYGYRWSRLGENLAGGTSLDTATKTVEAWLQSDSHCANLMDPNYTEVGMAMIKDENALYTHYWAQNFGTAE